MNQEITKEQEIALKDMKQFMKNDMAIKNALIDMAPNEILDGYSDGLIDYSNKLAESFKDIEFYFSQIFNTFELNSIQQVVNEKLKQIKYNIDNCSFDRDAQKKLYRSNFSDMDIDTINKIKKSFCAYSNVYYKEEWANSDEMDVSDIEGFDEILQSCKTVNELLHAIHSYVVNNVDILQSLPKVDTKRDSYDPIELYGEENYIAKGIFDTMDPETSPLGHTMIIGFDDRTLMMVRDSGHAIVLEIDKELDGKIMVRYSIPKICNVEKVNNLRGVNKVLNDDIGTNGSFLIENIDQFSYEILDFIEKVPTDADIILNPVKHSQVEENSYTVDKSILEQDTEPVPIIDNSMLKQDTEPIPIIDNSMLEQDTEPSIEISEEENMLFSKEEIKDNIENIKFNEFKNYLKNIGNILGIGKKKDDATKDERG